MTWHTVVLVNGWILAALWAERVIESIIGLRSMDDLAAPQWDQPTSTSLSVVVPARNEAADIEACLLSLLAQDLPDLEIIAVDDRSNDATGSIMDRLVAEDTSHRLRIIHVTELPPGWLGKTHAMWTAGREARGEFILFTDGDVTFEPSCLRRALVFAAAQKADHVAGMPNIRTETFSERATIAFLQTMFLFGPRIWKAPDEHARDSVGVGAFNLVRRSAYEQAGSFQALPFEVVDDLKLGQLIKQRGFRQFAVFATGLFGLHWIKGPLGIVRNLTKNAFALIGYRWYFALLLMLGASWLHLAPFIGAIFASGAARWGYLVSLTALLAWQLRMQRKTQVSPLYAMLHPFAAALMVYTIAKSSLLTMSRGAIEWRGTSYSLEDLREAQKRPK